MARQFSPACAELRVIGFHVTSASTSSYNLCLLCFSLQFGYEFMQAWGQQHADKLFQAAGYQWHGQQPGGSAVIHLQ